MTHRCVSFCRIFAPQNGTNMEYIENTDLVKKMFALSENDVKLLDHAGALPLEGALCDVFLVVLCINGKAWCRLEDKVLEMKQWDVFFCKPNTFVENAMASIDFECRIFLMSPALFESILLVNDNVLDAGFFLIENPIVGLDEKEARQLLQNFEFLRSKLSLPKTAHRKEIINLLLQLMVYEFLDCIKPKLQLHDYSYSSSQQLFRRFMELVNDNTPLHRDVKFYADRLCITSKYLSAVCHKYVNKPASEVINGCAVSHLKRMLRTTDKSVKEIAFEAGFDNLSFFGKYVRRWLGMSPREYRMQQGK